MSRHYLLPCSCGKSVSIEVSQAGQEVKCVCGETLSVPSLLQIKKLPEDTARQKTSENVSENYFLRPFFFVLSIVFLNLALIMAYLAIIYAPHPMDVITKRKNLVTPEGKSAYKSNLLPIAPEDAQFLEFHTNSYSYLEPNWRILMMPESVEHLSPMDTIRYWETLRDGPALSPQFDESFETFKHADRIRWGTSIVSAVIMVVFFVLALFMPKKKRFR